MSWCVSAIGKPEAVGKKLATDFGKITYLSGVESELKENAARLVELALSGFSGPRAVKVSAGGSASNYNGAKTQFLKILIEPIYNLAE